MGQRLNRQAKSETEHNAAAGDADHSSEAEDHGGPTDIDASTGASIAATSSGKRKRPQIEEADDASEPLRPQTMATSSLSTWDRFPVSHLEAMTAQALEADGREDGSAWAETSSDRETRIAIEEFESVARLLGWAP